MIKVIATIFLMLWSAGLLRADPAHDVVDKALPELKGSVTRGDEYASGLYRLLTDKGIEAYLINFQWGYHDSAEFRGSFVVFKDSHGRYWGRQSTSLQSKWLSGKTPEEWTTSFYGSLLTKVLQVAGNGEMVAGSTPPPPPAPIGAGSIKTGGGAIYPYPETPLTP